MENKIPTAEEYLNDYYPEEDGNQMLTREQARRVMRGFAGLHREAALKAAIKNACNQDGEKYEEDLSSHSILTAYPTDLIK